MKRFSLLLVCAVLASAAFAQNELQNVAIVRLTKSEPITVKQLNNEVALMEKQTGRPLTVDEKNQVLDGLINQRLVMQAAERDKVTVSENELNQAVERLRASLAQSAGRAPTDAEFAQVIRQQYNLDIPTFRDQLRRQLIVEKYLLQAKSALFNSARPPTNDEIQDFYDLNRAQLVRPDTVRFSMIQVQNGQNRATSKALAESLVKEIGGSTSKFDEVVLRQGASAGFVAGDAGYLPKNPEGVRAVGQAIVNAAFRLKQGEVSPLVETDEGFQILKVTETYAQKQLGLDDVLDLGSKMTVRQYITAGLTQQTQTQLIAQAQRELYEELRKGSPFTVYSQYKPW